MLKKSKISYCSQWPKVKSLETKILIYDEILEKNLEVNTWIETFPHRLAVRAGEDLKTLESVIEIMNILQDLTEGESGRPTLVGLGGGSVSDFVGFISSIWKRGVPLIHVPSTWLSAIDSAHGGKTAVNLNSVKNQLGTFYSADEIWIIKPLLFTQPAAQSEDVKGEIIKTGLLAGGKLWKQIKVIETFTSEKIWPLMKALVEFKYKIVNQDPYEKKGIRHVLNLGHTFGHAYEAHFGASHGASVYQGLRFAIEFSQANKIMTKDTRNEVLSSKCFSQGPDVRIESEEFYNSFLNLLAQDKKTNSKGEVAFIFVKKPGQVILKEKKLEAILSFLR